MCQKRWRSIYFQGVFIDKLCQPFNRLKVLFFYSPTFFKKYPLAWTNIPFVGIHPHLRFRDRLKVWISFNQSQCLTPKTLKPLIKQASHKLLYLLAFTSAWSFLLHSLHSNSLLVFLFSLSTYPQLLHACEL